MESSITSDLFDSAYVLLQEKFPKYKTFHWWNFFGIHCKNQFDSFFARFGQKLNKIKFLGCLLSSEETSG